jgi:hypothetical protein
MSDRRLHVATRKGLFSFRRGRSAWEPERHAFLGDHATVVLPDRRDGAVYVALAHGHYGAKLHRSDDGGATWTEIGVPVYPKQPDAGDESKNETTGQPLTWKLKKIWSLEPGGATRPGRLWCGTIPGGLFASDDRGASWRLVEPLWMHPRRKEWFGGGEPEPGIHSIWVDPRDPRRVGVGISCGGVWHTEDEGATWEIRATGMRANYLPPGQVREPNLQDPHRVVACAAAPDVLWCQHHNGVFRTTDAGRSWTELAPAIGTGFGFAAAIHPRDPKTSWLVPALDDEKRIPIDGKVVVARTRDGGATFELLRDGLPQEHAWDLVYRHGLDVAPDGDTLAMGSTTGSLWVSEDGGTRWATVSVNLPPIYAVRFG